MTCKEPRSRLSSRQAQRSDINPVETSSRAHPEAARVPLLGGAFDCIAGGNASSVDSGRSAVPGDCLRGAMSSFWWKMHERLA